MPESPGSSLLQGLNTGSTMMSRIMQPILERERLKQQQGQFVQNYAIRKQVANQQQNEFVKNYVLRKQAQDRANALMPYMIQQYQDTHKTAASEAEMKALYQNLIKDALNPQSDSPSLPSIAPPGMPPQMGGGQPNVPQEGVPSQMGGVPPQMGGVPNAAQGLPQGGQPPVTPPTGASMAPNVGLMEQQEHELRAGNPRLAKLDSVAGLVPGIPKPVQHISNGMVFTTYPSGRMTVQKVAGSAGQTPGERNVSAKEASKIRDQATALVNSANLVQQGYGLLDNNPDLTGIGSGFASKFNVSNNPELGKFTTVAGKLQAELGKYASSRGGIQAVNWAASVKPSVWKPQDYNYGMFEGIQQNLKDDYNTLNEQYKAATGKNLPVPLPNMTSTRNVKGKETGTAAATDTGKGKVTKWKMKGGQLVKE